MKRHVLAAVGGYLAMWAAIGYVVLVTAVKGPIDWPTVVQGGLIASPFGIYFGLMLESYLAS